MFGLSSAELRLISDYLSQFIHKREVSEEFKIGYLEALDNFKCLCIERIKENAEILDINEEQLDETKIKSLEKA